jgi:hypothetical protein
MIAKSGAPRTTETALKSGLNGGFWRLIHPHEFPKSLFIGIPLKQAAMLAA